MHANLLPFALATLALMPVGDPRRDTLPRDPGPRTEYFILEITAVPRARPVGTLCLRRRAVEGGFQLEGEWVFDRLDEGSGDERVLHIEQISDTGSKLIWREWGPSRARSLSVTQEAGVDGLAFVDSARGGTRRATLASRERAWLPLELLERTRLGDPPRSACARFDPLSRSVERVEVKLGPPATGAGGEPAPTARAYEIVREDGTIAGGFEFLGAELQSLRWQEGELVARRIDEKEYRERSPSSSVTIRRP